MMVKLIAALALCIHWFNPVVWAMYIFLNRDIELSCDESVVRQFGETSKSNYAKTLISMEEKKSGLIPLHNSFSRNAIEERITAIMKTKKMTIGMLIVSIIVIICIVVPFITSADDTGQGYAAKNELSGELLAYIDRLDSTTLSFDIVEWVTVPGERATELGITVDDAPSGFSIYNENVMIEELPLADNCVYRLLNWTDNYVQKDVTKEEMVSILAERKGTNIPYHLMIENNEISAITEQYVP